MPYIKATTEISPDLFISMDIFISGATLMSRKSYQLLEPDDKKYKGNWWLQDAAHYKFNAHCVNKNGELISDGNTVTLDAYVRPLILFENYDDLPVGIGQTFSFKGLTFKVLSESSAFLTDDLNMYPFNEEIENGNKYEKSDIKDLIDDWYQVLVNN